MDLCADLALLKLVFLGTKKHFNILRNVWFDFYNQKSNDYDIKIEDLLLSSLNLRISGEISMKNKVNSKH